MSEHDQPEQVELSEWQLWLLFAALALDAALSIGLVAGLLSSPMP